MPTPRNTLWKSTRTKNPQAKTLFAYGLIAFIIQQEYGKVLWVGGLDERVTERELWQGCFEWGVVKSLFVHNNRQSASITFNTPEEAQTALDMLQGNILIHIYVCDS